MEAADAQVLPAGGAPRAVVLMRISLFIKRGKAAYEADGVYLEFANPAAVADVFEDCVIPHAAAAASWP